MVTIMLVRHADIDLPPGTADPELNVAGRRRAVDLARVVERAGVRTVFTSALTRTKQTVEPLAEQFGIAPAEVPSAEELARAARAGRLNSPVLIAGHSDTVPLMIETLRGPPVPPIAAGEFDNLYVVTLAGHSAPGVLRLRYGDPSP